MTDCTIIISNYNSLHWLRIAVHQIRKHTKHPYHIIISEQSEDPYDVQAEYNGWNMITVVPNPAHSSGAGLDYVLKNVEIKTEYVCAIDVDTFPISDEWLSFPIALLKECGLTWVGLRAEIERAYGLNYFHIAECYRVGRLKDFRLLSDLVGWYQRKGDPFFDNAVCAQAWEDEHYKHKKLSLPVTGRIGLTLTEGEYGRVIGNLAMHFCLAFTSTLHERREKNVGDDYLMWEEEIKSCSDPDRLVDKIMGAVKYSHSLQPMQYWDGEKETEPSIELRSKIELHTQRKGALSVPLYSIVIKYGIKVRGVIHAGAHYGQEMVDYEDNEIGNVVMFEPLSSAYAELIKRMPDYVRCYKLALGNTNGIKTLLTEDANEGMSSSFLQPAKHLEAYPDIVFNGAELVNMVRLDDMDIDFGLYNMLNIDVQGYELEVLRGAVKTLRGIDLIYIEVNLSEMYEGCPVIDDIDGFLHDFKRVETNWLSGDWGDAVYIRK